tara:strand:+ start:406 stop:768 length:363 start_codon:yes stop_codon:yes gene_type:complete
MAFVMTAAPLAIVGYGFGVAEAALDIQWHVLAMFVPSLFTGKLISRFGKLSIVAAGLVLLMLCSIVALPGISIEHFYVGLILLGLGSGIAYEFIGWETMSWIPFPIGFSYLAALFLLHQR